jgi:O-antigen ligase
MLLVAVPVLSLAALTLFTEEIAFAVERLGVEDTVDARLVQANAGRQMFYAKPLFGWGFDSYDRHDWKFMERVGNAAPTRWDVRYGTSHNTYVTILAETGLFGLFFQFFPVVWWLVRTIRTIPRLPRRGFWSWRLLVVIWLPLISFLTIGQFLDFRFSWFSIGTFWLVLGLVPNMTQAFLGQTYTRMRRRPVT